MGFSRASSITRADGGDPWINQFTQIMPFSPRTLLAVAASFCLALVLTFLVRSFARRFGFVAKPKIDRWHKEPTAMLGGAAIWLSVVITAIVFSLQGTYGKFILLASTFLFLVGLV